MPRKRADLLPPPVASSSSSGAESDSDSASTDASLPLLPPPSQAKAKVASANSQPPNPPAPPADAGMVNDGVRSNPAKLVVAKPRSLTQRASSPAPDSYSDDEDEENTADRFRAEPIRQQQKPSNLGHKRPSSPPSDDESENDSGDELPPRLNSPQVAAVKPATEKKKKKKKTTPPPPVSPSAGFFQRVWSEEEEMNILLAVSQLRAPYSDHDLEVVARNLKGDGFPLNKVREKIRKLKDKYIKNVKKYGENGPSDGTSMGRSVFELSKQMWGKNSDGMESKEKLANGFPDSTKPSSSKGGKNIKENELEKSAILESKGKNLKRESSIIEAATEKLDAIKAKKRKSNGSMNSEQVVDDLPQPELAEQDIVATRLGSEGGVQPQNFPYFAKLVDRLGQVYPQLELKMAFSHINPVKAEELENKLNSQVVIEAKQWARRMELEKKALNLLIETIAGRVKL